MIDFLKWLVMFILGNDKKARFKRFVLLVAVILLSQCISFGFDKKGNFYFSFTPFVKINKEL